MAKPNHKKQPSTRPSTRPMRQRNPNPRYHNPDFIHQALGILAPQDTNASQRPQRAQKPNPRYFNADHVSAGGAKPVVAGQQSVVKAVVKNVMPRPGRRVAGKSMGKTGQFWNQLPSYNKTINASAKAINASAKENDELLYNQVINDLLNSPNKVADFENVLDAMKTPTKGQLSACSLFGLVSPGTPRTLDATLNDAMNPDDLLLNLGL